MTYTQTLVIGASAAGLATAACLQKAGIEYVILEKQPQLATAWRNHYDRLHLHTSKKWSALPFKNFDEEVPKYPGRRQVVEYLDSYAGSFGIVPVFNTEALSIKKEGEHWLTVTNAATYRSKFVIVATGLNHEPVKPVFSGMDSFNGEIIHSSAYKNGAAFHGKRVLVVGFGNSGCEQAICLHEHGAFPSLSVRSAVNVLPCEILGMSVLELGKLTNRLPARLADKINAPLIRMLVGDITKLGLRKSVYGPREQIELQKRIPLLDVGTIRLIREGHIKVYRDIVRINGNTVYFSDYRNQQFDAIILATGYRHSLEKLLTLTGERMQDLVKPVGKQNLFGEDGLYFCGFYVSHMGMLREIGIEAKKIAKDILIKN